MLVCLYFQTVCFVLLPLGVEFKTSCMLVNSCLIGFVCVFNQKTFFLFKRKTIFPPVSSLLSYNVD